VTDFRHDGQGSAAADSHQPAPGGAAGDGDVRRGRYLADDVSIAKVVEDLACQANAGAPRALRTLPDGRAAGAAGPQAHAASLPHPREGGNGALTAGIHAYAPRPRPCLAIGCGTSRSREHPSLRSTSCRPASRSQRKRSRAEIVQPRRTFGSPPSARGRVPSRGRCSGGLSPVSRLGDSSRRYWSRS
jgi:hypothetical protein